MLCIEIQSPATASPPPRPSTSSCHQAMRMSCSSCASSLWPQLTTMCWTTASLDSRRQTRSGDRAEWGGGRYCNVQGRCSCALTLWPRVAVPSHWLAAMCWPVPHVIAFLPSGAPGGGGGEGTVNGGGASAVVEMGQRGKNGWGGERGDRSCHNRYFCLADK
jgi:hypothetical protein